MARAVWPLALLISMGVHGALLTSARQAWGPEPLSPQSLPEAKLDIAAQTVATSLARPADAAGEQTDAATPSGPLLGGAAIPQSVAVPQPAASLGTPATRVPRPQATRPLALPDAGGPVAALGQRLAAAGAQGATLAGVPMQGDPLPQITPASERQTASLAWTGADRPLDAVSLAAISAFTQPGDLTEAGAGRERLRDDLAALLASVPCARLQTEFDPDTGSLELRGHIPEDGLRGPVLAALQMQVGASIPVTDQMMILPRPQCAALGAMADVGLPSSTEQDTNPRIIGAQSQLRTLDLRAGQRLVFEMTAPDYPAYIYADYFAADGSVLHMQPNEAVPAQLSSPKSPLAVGQDAPGRPALQLIVGPPFGQEIAVAFATSAPLYDGVRPTVEPAADYLAFLRAAVAERRATTPDFKGEWVYFLVTTAP